MYASLSYWQRIYFLLIALSRRGETFIEAVWGRQVPGLKRHQFLQSPSGSVKASTMARVRPAPLGA